MEHSKTHKILKTPLHAAHIALGAKMMEFAGWEMPLFYSGIVSEHKAVRTGEGIFDISHMGRILIEGSDAETLLDYLSTNQIKGKPDLSATYTVWCNSDGGCVDDLIIYKQSRERYFVIVNASNRQKDLQHLQKYAAGYSVKITNLYDEEGILAVQGPKAKELVQKLFPIAADIPHMHFQLVPYHDMEIVLSHTGYTGAGGFEIYGPHAAIVQLWNHFLEAGKQLGIVPVGLGARDTLRLEMGYALYGHEINDDIAPIESIAAWTVKWDKEFLGKEALQRLQESPGKRAEYGVILIDKGIARSGYDVLQGNEVIGTVTSGTHSPTLNQPIAIILVRGALKIGDEVEIQIRQNRCRAQVVKLPFIIGNL